jgi:hypothetical protein
MSRETEQLIGTLLVTGGALALVLPVVVSRRYSRPLGVGLGVVLGLPAVLAISAGRKLRTHPPRREITLGKLHENATWHRIWDRLGLA